jgi:quercetin dioxygenase-like cupin family protein
MTIGLPAAQFSNPQKTKKQSMNTKSDSLFVASAILRARFLPPMKACALFLFTISVARADVPARITELRTQALVGAPGKEVTMITVEYAPGAADPVHRHDASAFIYVLEGSIVMAMQGDKEVTLHPGDTFYEEPHGVHLVGRNASDKVPAKFVVFLVKDEGKPYFIPVTK